MSMWINQKSEFGSIKNPLSLTEMEKRVLESVNRQLLVSVSELLKALEKEELDGAGTILNRLKEEGFLNIIEPLGKTSYVITQKGMRALRG